ncbi:hypothetical protein Bbelb_324070 [Branchiostoma belcheri]|nr:hypothetical protein Bbelb_324070 [Branchiostoma belcheri]
MKGAGRQIRQRGISGVKEMASTSNSHLAPHCAQKVGVILPAHRLAGYTCIPVLCTLNGLLMERPAEPFLPGQSRFSGVPARVEAAQRGGQRGGGAGRAGRMALVTRQEWWVRPGLGCP